MMIELLIAAVITAILFSLTNSTEKFLATRQQPAERVAAYLASA